MGKIAFGITFLGIISADGGRPVLNQQVRAIADRRIESLQADVERYSGQIKELYALRQEFIRFRTKLIQTNKKYSPLISRLKQFGPKNPNQEKTLEQNDGAVLDADRDISTLHKKNRIL
jgi:hypothetical protein